MPSSKAGRFIAFLVLLVVLAGGARFVFFRSPEPRMQLPAEEIAPAIPDEIEQLYSRAKADLSGGDEESALATYHEITDRFNDDPRKDQALYFIGSYYEATGNLTEAKKWYERFLADCPGSSDLSQVQGKLWNVNMKLLFDSVPMPGDIVYEVKPGDTLTRIAKEYNTTVELLKRSNGLPSDLIRIGQKLKVTGYHFSIFVNKAQNILVLKADDEVFKIYTVATGTNNSTPTGTFTIINKLVDPTWYTMSAVIPAGSPENILGTRWMGISAAGYGIHGTTEPESLGQQVTAGCVRMKNKDVEELYAIIPVGTEVTISD